ncbi:MAG: DNA polymerase III subunit gamma/tau [Ignavibacteria bacterium]|nr:DNA polymerase III subunit gamma/tau [Ignavibacteria bacterium]
MNEYKVSALKYRPQRFDEVISQEFATQTLKNAIISKKIAHSYLISGPRGIGKTTIARIFAKALNCKNQKDGEPCNECESCIEITSGIHPDIFELDAASNRGIDDVRAIQDAAKFYPVKASYKFFIVDEVHMLTIQAFNALLKILEEPPPYLIFILATTNPEKIPPTITSRCQKFNLQRIKLEDISKRILDIAKKENITIDEQSVFLISKLGDGALRDALGIFDLAVSFCGTNIVYSELKEFFNLPEKEIYFKASDFIYRGDTKGILEYFSDLLERGFDLHTFYTGLTEHFRNILIVSSTKDANLIDESDVIKTKYLEESKKFTDGQLLRILQILFDDEQRFKFSANQRILLEAILVELCRINKEVVDLEKLISELEEFKKKTSEQGLANFKNVNSLQSKGNSEATQLNQEIVYKIEHNFPEPKVESVSDFSPKKEPIPEEKNNITTPEVSTKNSDDFRNLDNPLIKKIKSMFDVEEERINNIRKSK